MRKVQSVAYRAPADRVEGYMAEKFRVSSDHLESAAGLRPSVLKFRSLVLMMMIR